MLSVEHGFLALVLILLIGLLLLLVGGSIVIEFNTEGELASLFSILPLIIFLATTGALVLRWVFEACVG